MTVPAALDVGALVAPLSIVGDVHLAPEDPATSRRFLAWLDQRSSQGGTLVLLGDIFESWAGRPQQFEPLAKAVLDRLRRLAQGGVALRFIAGNRDHLFDGADGLALTLWPDVVRAELGKQRVLITHGDLLCTRDHSYLAWRRFLRSRAGRCLPLILPYRVRQWLARGLRGVSRRAVRVKPMVQMELDYGAARAWLHAHGASALLVGHVHTGAHHRQAGPPACEVLVLKDWERGGSVIEWDGKQLRLAAPSLS